MGWQSPAAPGGFGASEIAAGAGVDAGLRCKQSLLWACLIAVLQMGLEKARVTGFFCRQHGPASAHQLTQGSRKRGHNCTRSENYEKTLMAWGIILVEALRNRSLVRASNGGSKMPRRGRSPQNAPASELAAAARRALYPKLAFLAA